MDKRKSRYINKRMITTIVNNSYRIGWGLFVILFIWVVYIKKDSLTNPNTLDIRVLSGIILVEILLIMVKVQFRLNDKK